MDSKVTTDIELAVGTFDEDVLLGGRDGEDRSLGGYAIALANPEGHHHHTRNEIKGITEEVSTRGIKYWEGGKEGPMK
jgi:hypothetical protein